MKLVFKIISLCVLLIFLGLNCSDEEAVMVDEQKTVVKKKISVKSSITPERGEANDIPVKNDPVTTEIVDIGEGTNKEKGNLEARINRKDRDQKGLYIVKAGNSLSSIAKDLDIYNDSLKWVLIYYSNQSKLNKLKITENLPDVQLEQGLELKIATLEDTEGNLIKQEENFWVINILSAMTNKEIVPNAVKLIKNGYQPYITKVQVKGDDWMRLRIGFYGSKKEALESGEKIKSLLNLSEIWPTKVDKEELDNFGRYLEGNEG